MAWQHTRGTAFCLCPREEGQLEREGKEERAEDRDRGGGGEKGHANIFGEKRHILYII